MDTVKLVYYLYLMCQIEFSQEFDFLPLLFSIKDSTSYWNEYKSKYNKSYASNLHESSARKAWVDNLMHISQHNSAGRSFNLTDNHFSDLTLRQYLRRVVKLVRDDHPHNESLSSLIHQEDVHIPDEIDWREKGFIPAIPSQGRCGACYAFTVAHAVQAQLLKTKHIFQPLSEQQMIDCSGSWGNYGCGGGSLTAALKYLHKHGAMAYKDYPYQEKQSKCQWNKSKVIATVAKWEMVDRGDEMALQRAVALIGPVPVSINAAPRTFQLYHSGIYDDQACTNNSVNHAVLVVGYTPNYWLILNWWGTHWGQKGYMKLKKGQNRCGITNFAAYLTIE